MVVAFGRDELVMAMFLLLRRRSKRSAKKPRNFWVRKLFLERKSRGDVRCICPTRTIVTGGKQALGFFFSFNFFFIYCWSDIYGVRLSIKNG